jgi:hypothetical protein
VRDESPTGAIAAYVVLAIPALGLLWMLIRMVVS